MTNRDDNKQEAKLSLG